MANYSTYPCKYMNITQSYLGTFSHYNNYNGIPKDYPIDEACKDAGRDWFYCPCDEMQIVTLLGVYNGYTNNIILQSTTKVDMPIGFDYLVISVYHPMDDDLGKLKVGQKFKRGQKMFREGTDGNATGNHFHLTCAKGKFDSKGMIENNKRAWVLSGNTIKPEEAFYLDSKFTQVINRAGLTFKTVPKELYTLGTYEVKKDSRIRVGAGTSFKHKTFAQFSKQTQTMVLKNNQNKKTDWLVPKCQFTVTSVENKNWGRCGEGYVALNKCYKIK